MSERFITMIGGSKGPFRVQSIRAICGDSLASVAYVDVRPSASLFCSRAEPSASTGTAPADLPAEVAAATDAGWQLSGAISNLRYATSTEREHYGALQAPLGRTEARLGALIPIRKTQAWWDLPQDARRSILADQSRHISIGTEYLPAIARRLLHCRDLGSPQPFDFLTWFEFAPELANAFDELLVRLRATREWEYVDREVEVRFEQV